MSSSGGVTSVLDAQPDKATPNIKGDLSITFKNYSVSPMDAEIQDVLTDNPVIAKGPTSKKWSVHLSRRLSVWSAAFPFIKTQQLDKWEALSNGSATLTALVKITSPSGGRITTHRPTRDVEVGP